MDTVVDVADHVRYVIALMRVDGSGKHYAAMKISIEVAASFVEEKVVDIVARAIRRELPHDDHEVLIQAVSAVVLSWFAALQLGTKPIFLQVGDVILYGHHTTPSHTVKQYIQTSIFTKADEERVNKLFPRL
jgi:uncharacterized RmlC-like cupin family protein